MKLYRPVRLHDRIQYPNLDQVKAYTETYRVEFMDRENPDKGWHKFFYSVEVEVLTIGGINDYFVIYAYPPAGFESAYPEDILTRERWQGLILELVGCEPTYRLDTATYREGERTFKIRKVELGY